MPLEYPLIIEIHLKLFRNSIMVSFKGKLSPPNDQPTLQPRSVKDNAWIKLLLKPNITPVTLIREKDNARIMNILFKVKLLVLAGQFYQDLLWWNFSYALFFLVNSKVTVLPGSCLQQVLKYYTAKFHCQILGKHHYSVCSTNWVFWKGWKCSRKMPMLVSCFSNVNLWLYDNTTPP